MEVEIVGRARRGLEDADRLPPVIAFRLTDRETVQRGERGIGARRDQRLAGDIGFIAGELRPESGFKIDILTHRHGAKIGQGRQGLRHRRIECIQRFGPHQHAHMVLTQPHRPGGEIVLGRHQPLPQAHGFLVGGAHPAQGQIDALQTDLAIDESEALCQGHLERQAQYGVAHARCGVWRIILQR